MGEFALTLATKTHSWIRAALIVTAVQVAAAITIFTINVDFDRFPGSRIFDLLDLLAFLPGKLVLLALRGQYPHGGSIVYYIECMAITWVIFTVCLRTFIARGHRKPAVGDDKAGSATYTPSLVWAARHVGRRMLITDVVVFFAWELVTRWRSDIGSWIALAFAILLMNSVMVLGVYYRERSRGTRHIES